MKTPRTILIRSQNGEFLTKEIYAQMRRGMIVQAPRQCGKTTALLQLAATIISTTGECAIVVPNPTLMGYASPRGRRPILSRPRISAGARLTSTYRSKSIARGRI